MPDRQGFYAKRRGIEGLVDQNGIIGSIARFYQRSYAGDYIGLTILLTAYILLENFIEPFHRMFSLDNTAIQFPHAEVERVPVSWLFGYAGGIPLLVLVLWAVSTRPSAHTAHVTFLGLFISLILTSFITDIVKNAVGRPRPDLISRCKPAKGTPEHKLVTFEICTEGNHHVLHDGWRSFPSGHSSFAFSGLGYLAFFLCGQLHIFQSYHPRASKADLSRILVALIAPLLGAALIAISRCEDYRHDVWDVTTGSALGLLVAWGVYRRFYPPLSSRPISNTPPSPSPVFTLSCDTPYPVMGMGPEGRWNSRGGGGNGYVGGGEYGGEGFGYSRPADAEDGGFPEMENGTSRGEAVPLREMDRRRSDVGNMV